MADLSIGLWLRMLRRQRKWTPRDLEFESGVPVFVIEQIESGRRQMECHTSAALAKGLFIEREVLDDRRLDTVMQVLSTLPTLPRYSQVPRPALLRESPISHKTYGEKVWREIGVLFRSERGFTVEELADRCNMTLREVKRTEQGYPEEVERHWLKLVRGLKVRPSDYDWRTWQPHKNEDAVTVKSPLALVRLRLPKRRHLAVLQMLADAGPLPKRLLRERLKAANETRTTPLPISLRSLTSYKYIERWFGTDLARIRRWHPEYTGQMLPWFEITERGREVLRRCQGLQGK